ncbi:AAA family ATPase [Anaeroselena agilis]|uniref:DNMP kinase n=1 Tax=Anaeroselena agilis TaxID=3063788 RepID=A0ABU3NVN7_9FIRM|nr:hypothetical protein [Selenomonadales bacterium 4137-cl]
MTQLPSPQLKIGLIGRICSGKDTVGEVLIKTLGYQRFAFGDPIRSVYQVYLDGGWQPAFELLCLYSDTIARFTTTATTFKDIANSSPTRREFLQKVGTWARQLDDDIWVRTTFRQLPYLVQGYGVGAVCTDVRRRREYEVLRDAGFKFIHVTAPEAIRRERMLARDASADTSVFGHVSEQEIDEIGKMAHATVENDEGKAKLLTATFEAIDTIRQSFFTP